MKIYENLRNSKPVFAGDISRLLQAINTSARLIRRDANKFKTQRKNNGPEIEQLSSYLLTVAEDLHSGKVEAKPWGFSHLFTAFGTLDSPQVGLDLWKHLSDETSECAEIAWSPVVTGSIIELLTVVDAPFDVISQIYSVSKERGEASNVEQAMIGAFIKFDMNADALDLFSKFIKTYPDKTYGLTRIHDKFVGDSTDLPTALNFFYEGIENKTPYKAITHPSKVASLMQKVWHSGDEPSLDSLERIWKDYISSLSPTLPEWTFSITVHRYMQAFMETYPEPTPEAVTRLKDIIRFYTEKRIKISSTFLNTILSAIQPWGDHEVVIPIIDAFKKFQLAEDTLSCRIILNSLENIDVDETYINDRWQKLVDSQKGSLSQYDIVALLRACHLPSREPLFAEIFESLLMQNQVSNDTLIGVSQTLIFNERMNSKKPIFDSVLRSNYIEVTNDKQVVRFSPYEPLD